MSLSIRVLGEPGCDNALWVRVDSGQAVHRLLFDCGDGCASRLGFAELAETAHLFFSHFHMDHVGGFDTFFRCSFDREASPVEVWGPAGAAEILHHRFRGYWWNLIDGSPGTWRVHEVTPEAVCSTRYFAAEAFAHRHEDSVTPFGGLLVQTADYSVEAVLLNHGGPSLAYLVREPNRRNIQPERLASLGLRPGPWLQELAKGAADGSVEIDGKSHRLSELRDALWTESAGGSVAYLTDFLLDPATEDRLAVWLSGCQTMVCEAQYRHADLELATKHHHTTVRQVAQLAARAGVERLVLIHLSQRYSAPEWASMLAEAKEVFPATEFAEEWSSALAGFS